VLVAHDCSTPKFKWALIMGIPIVTLEWLVDSYKAKAFQDERKYAIKALFYRLVVCLFGFAPDKEQALEQELRGQQAIVVKEHSLAKLNDLEDLHVIVASPEKEGKLRRFKKDVPVVTVDWLVLCLEQRRTVYPPDMAINIEFRNLPLYQKLKDKKKGMEARLAESALSSRSPDLSECIMGLKGYAKEVEGWVTLLVTHCSAFLSSTLDSTVTHILVDDVPDSVLAGLRVSHPQAYLVRLDWLWESFKAERRLD
jgi:hypothetical protein